MPERKNSDDDILLNPNCTVTLRQNKWLEEQAGKANTSKAAVLRDAIDSFMEKAR
jgi:tRNA A37 threonylcarbamoyladenosine dehydratase